ncbi:MAG: DUF4381 family protein [Thermoguttaceae bacterium]|nr:DUF4381 family protein [Thermoguttaceae bacterium]
MKNPIFSSVRLRAFHRGVASLIVVAVFAISVAASDSTKSLENFTRQIEISSSFGSATVASSAVSERSKPLAPISLTLEIEKPRKLALLDDAIPSVYGDFDVVLESESRRDANVSDREIFVRRLTLYPRRRGTLVFPPLPLRFSDATADADDVCEPSTITALLPPTTLEIPETDAPRPDVAEIEPDYSPIRVFPVAFGVALTAAVLAVALAAFLLFQRKRRTLSGTLAQESPLEEATRRLDELKNSRLYLENDAEFYSVIASILRRYLSAEFGIDAEEKTTRETLLAVDAELVSANETPATSATSDETYAPKLSEEERVRVGFQVLKNQDIRIQIEQTLSATDLVKFARRRTTFEDARQIFDATRQIIADASRRFAVALEKAAQERATVEEKTVSAASASASIFLAPSRTNERR